MPGRTPDETRITVDFTNVQEGSGGPRGAHVPEGDYLLKVVKAGARKNRENDGKHVVWQCKIIKGAEVGGTVYHRTTLQEENLWSLRNFITALKGGTEPKKSVLNIDLTKYVGKEFGATLVDGEPYNNKIKSEIADAYPAQEYKEDGSTSDDDDDELEDTSDDEDELETVDDDDI